MDHILSIVLFTPLAGLLVLLFIPSSNARAIKLWANAIALLGFLVSVPLALRFDPKKDFQFVEKASWIPSLGATYHIGIDGLGLLLVMLTTLVGFLAILSSWNAIHERLNLFVARYIAWKDDRIVQKRGQVPNIFSKPFILMRENEPSARGINGMGNSPSNAALVGDAQNKAGFSFKEPCHRRLTLP